ncbi:hypothetical protein GCM10023212_18910 [Luteolibacter yonseiensis]
MMKWTASAVPANKIKGGSEKGTPVTCAATQPMINGIERIHHPPPATLRQHRMIRDPVSFNWWKRLAMWTV